VDLPIAQRLQRIPPYPFREIAAIKRELQAQGVEPTDFGIGDPDMPTPGFVIEALHSAAQDPATHPYDETGFGIPEYLEAIADFGKRRYGLSLDPEAGQIQSCLGSKEALAHIIWAYIDPSDVVLVPDPAYSVYKVQTTWAGGAAFPMPLDPANGFLPDFSAIPTGVARAAKLLFLNYPNNPTGAVATREFFAVAVEFARKWNILIVQDAAYNEVAFDGFLPPSILEIEGAEEVAIEMHSFSKTFNMTGWRVAWAWGGAPQVAALSKVKANVDSGTFMALQRAGAAALANYDAFVPSMRAEYQARRDTLVDGLNSLGWNLQKPRATFYVWAPVPPAYATSADFAAALLHECHVLVIPGTSYGDTGEGWFRLSLTLKDADKLGAIAAAVERIRTRLPRLWG
jgi:LL-diaminopimelate aminotransferase